MNLSLKFLVLFIICTLINKCVTEDTPVEQNAPVGNNTTTENTVPVASPNNNSTSQYIDPTDCDTLKLVLSDYSSLESAITWGDHTMDCCDGKKYVCQDIEGQKYITELNLGFNYLSGSISSHIANFTNLEKLDLHKNKLTGNLPIEFKQLKNLKILNLNSNSLSGDFPKFIGDLSSLRSIDISNNEFTGQLPESLNLLNYLESFYASYNLISGGLTDFFTSTPNLTVLDLSLNKIEGSIPKSINHLYNLTELYLNDNKLEGTLPNSFYELENLEVLNVNNNKELTGRVPDMPKYLKSCNYKDTDLCVTEKAVCGLDQVPICKIDTKAVIITVVGCIIVVAIILLILTKLCLRIKRGRNKEKQSDQALLVGGDDPMYNDNLEEGEFIQLREPNDNRRYVEVDEDYIFTTKNMNKFID